jgi:hypothetical protein
MAEELQGDAVIYEYKKQEISQPYEHHSGIAAATPQPLLAVTRVNHLNNCLIFRDVNVSMLQNFEFILLSTHLNNDSQKCINSRGTWFARRSR